MKFKDKKLSKDYILQCTALKLLTRLNAVTGKTSKEIAENASKCLYQLTTPEFAEYVCQITDLLESIADSLLESQNEETLNLMLRFISAAKDGEILIAKE